MAVASCPNSPTGYHWLVGTEHFHESKELVRCKFCVLERWVAITWDKCVEESSRSPKTPPIYVKPNKLRKPVGRQYEQMKTGDRVILMRRRTP
ncbi:hypothetical protein LCGC14_1330190 [marine sediment metagenome]|uniref:Uncharacterized protein n=1 Tax=marine sediment metagenome TaxID=412755 RepID=A0A0F9MXQ5_9ZZZZ